MGGWGLVILTGRIYEPTPSGVLRVLVDRLWPRGVRKEGAPWDVWLKDVAPSNELRTWYHANPEAREEFRRRYTDELAQPERAAALAQILELGRRQPIALVTATRDVGRGQVPILRDALLTRETS